MSCIVPIDMRWMLPIPCLQEVGYQPVIVPSDFPSFCVHTSCDFKFAKQSLQSRGQSSASGVAERALVVQCATVLHMRKAAHNLPRSLILHGSPSVRPPKQRTRKPAHTLPTLSVPCASGSLTVQSLPPNGAVGLPHSSYSLWLLWPKWA